MQFEASRYKIVSRQRGVLECLVCWVSRAFVNRMDELLKTTENTDVVFVVGTSRQIFRGHRLVLATVGSCLAAVSDTNQETIVVLEDTDPRIFADVLRYIYTGQIVLSSILDAICVSYVAQKFMIPDLWHFCLSYIKRFLTRDLVNNVRKMAAYGVQHPKEFYPSTIRNATKAMMRKLQNIDDDGCWQMEEVNGKEGVKPKQMRLNSEIAFLDYLSSVILQCHYQCLEPTFSNMRDILARYWRIFLRIVECKGDAEVYRARCLLELRR